MTLIVTDSAGRKYKPTGCFREPKPGEFLYCFDCKSVEQRFPSHIDSGICTLNGVNRWCSHGHVEFLLHRIIVEPVPEPKYEVTVPFTEADMRMLHSRLGEDGNWLGKRAASLIFEGNYREVSQ